MKIQPRIAVIIPAVFPIHLSRIRNTLSSETRAQQRCDVAVFTILVINGVPHDKERFVHKFFSKLPASGLVSGTNRGFSQAVNDGILYAQAKFDPDWYFILNDDAELHSNFFERLHDVLRRQDIDAVTCKVLTPRGEVESVGLRYLPTGLAFPRKTDISSKDKPIFSGTCVLLSRKRVEKELDRHGYVFNPLYFAYAEDLELSLRILHDGGNIFISNEALVTHEGSQTAKRGSYFQLYHGYRNLVLTVLLMWPRSAVLRHLPMLITGQIYIFGMSVYKGYWLLYPKLWWWIIKNWKSIMWQRNQYDTR